MRALVVDDSSAMRSILRMIFRKAGFEVTEASNGYEALNRWPKSLLRWTWRLSTGTCRK